MGTIGRTGAVFLATTLAAAGAAAYTFWPATPSVGGSPANLPPEDIAAGRTIYAAQCASCHGVDLEGAVDWRTPGPDGSYPAPPHDQTGHTWHHDDATLFDYLRIGGAGMMAAQGLTDARSGMPSFADILTDAEIRDVLAYIASTWPDRIRAARAARTDG